ncbi:MAG: DUF4097 family beta strand repeat protein [Gorillibacterium sp.]|nr:DUF4097 family beta strand repeat protein [Gorillibacterium sp.]
MKRSFFLVLLIAFFIGLSIFGIYIYQSLFSDKPSSPIGDSRSFNAEEINKVTISSTRADVQITQGTGNEIKLELNGKASKSKDISLNSELKGSELIIQVVQKGSGFFGTSSVKLSVILPKKHYERLNASTTSGDQSLSHVWAGQFELSTISGDIDARNLAGVDLVAKTTSGDVELEDWTGNVTASTVSGDLQLKRLQGDKLISRTTSGDVEAHDLMGKELRVTTVSGDVELEGTAEISNVSTTSGSLTLDLQGAAKSVEMSSVSGDLKIVLPKETAYKLESKTVSGDVQIDANEFKYTDKSKRHVAGSLGEGGMSLTFKTISGDMTITE